MRVFKALLKTVFGVLLVCTVLLALTLGLALTPWGLNLTVAGLQKIHPALTVEKTQGNLLNATLQGVKLEEPGVSISAKSFHYTLANIAILDRFVSVSDVATQGLKIAVRSNEDSSNTVSSESSQEKTVDISATQNRPITLPVGFKIDSVLMTDTDVAIDETHIHFDAFETSLKGAQSKISVGQTTLKKLLVTMPQAPDTAPKPPAQTIKDFFETPLLSDFGEVKLPLEVAVSRFSLLDFHFNDQKFVDSLILTLSAKASNIHLTKIEAATPFAQLSSEVSVSTTGLWPVSAHLAFRDVVAIEHFGKPEGNATLEGELFSTLKIDAELTQPQPLRLTGTANLVKPDAALDLTLTGNLQLPQMLFANTLPGAAHLDVRSVQLSGSFSDWTLQANTSIVLPAPYPAGDVKLRLKGQKLAFDYALWLLAQKSAEVEINGNARLTNEGLSLSADTLAKVSDLEQLIKSVNVQVNHPLAKGNAIFKGSLKIRTDATLAHFQAPGADFELTGKLAGNPLDIKLKASANETMDIDVHSFVATLANNRLQAHGAYRKTGVEASAFFQAPELFLITPKLTGKVTGNVTVSGPQDALSLKAQMSAQRLKYDTDFADSVNLVADVINLGKTHSKVKLEAGGIHALNQTVDKVSFGLTGTQRKHTLIAKIDSDDASLNLSWAGVWDAATEVWNSHLNQGAIGVAQTRWIAEGKPEFKIELARESLTIGKHCWKQRAGQARVCLKEPMKIAKAGSAALNFTDWPLSFAQSYAPAGVKLMGSLKGDIQAKWTAPDVKAMELEANLDAQGAGLRATVSEKPVEVTLKTAQLSATLDKNTAQVNATLAVTPDNPLKALVRVTDPTGKAEMAAKVTSTRLSLDEFSGIIAAFSAISKTSGFLTTDLTLSGTPQAPLVYGSIDISSLQLYGPTIPLDMQPSNFTLTFKGSESQLSGKLVSSEGPLSFDGQADWSDIQAPEAGVHVTGKNFRVVSAPYVKALLSPDVRMTVTDRQMTLSGKISIDQAQLSAESIPQSAVTVSDDEVIVDADMKPVVKKASRPLAIDSSLAIELGENVRVKAFGLAAQLQGTVTVTQTNDTLGLRGTLTMPDGRFQAYGQDLIIQKGSFIFAGPVNDPIVELVAQRNPDSVEDDVTVGIRVSGNVSQMKSEIFSDPSMDQASQLSYLLRGRGLESNTEDNSMLSSALLTVGLSQAGQLISGIGDALMIRDLGVSTQGVGDNSQVVVSGYVLPDLQVKYAMNIFDSLNTLTLRYRLMPKLFVEASSGVNQAIDVLYNFEF